MTEVKSLVESRAFWSALLALTALVASAFHLTQFAAWAADPATVDSIVQGVGMLGAMGAIVFRYLATARTVTILPPGSGPGAGKALALTCALPLAGSLGACSQTQLTSYTVALTATGNVLKQIGQDVVAIDCASASLVQVIAKDAGAAARVQASLARNAAIARDACPSLTGAPAVQVIAGA